MNAKPQEIVAASTWDTPVAPTVSESAAIISMIERMASDPNIDIARLEKILDLRERVETQNARRAYASALAEMQPHLPTVERNGRIKIAIKADRDKPEHEQRMQQSTPYALFEDINDAIRPVLAAHGFALSFRTGTTPESKITVTGILSHREGHQEETTMVLTHDSTGSKNAVQAIGSSLSYGKRYTAMLLLNITSRAAPDKDDDGKKAGEPETITQQQADDLRDLMESVGANTALFLKYYAIGAVEELPASKYEDAVKKTEAKRAK